jgi:hypothetical protein
MTDLVSASRAGLKPVSPGKAPAAASIYPRTMAQEALVFLDDPLARKLAVAWGASHGDEDRWLEAAGIGPDARGDASRLCEALRLNGICQDGGMTDPLALRYIAAIVAEPLNKGKGGARGRRR